MIRRVIGIGILIIALIFGWHLYLTSEARRIAHEIGAKSTETGLEMSLSLSPITNVVNMTLTMPPPDFDEDNPWAAAGYQLGTALCAGLIKVMEPIAEREINTKARENFDIYAMLIPYRVRIAFEEPDEKFIARFRERQKERKEKEAEKKQKADALLKEASKLKKEKKLHAALQKYDQILGLDSEFVEAKQEKTKTEKEMKTFEQKEAYIKNIVLYGLEARYYKTYLEEKVPGVEFKLKNKGDRTLKEVEVTVYFKDATGAIIAEEDYHPVLVTKYSFRGDNKPLKPNYVWQMERGKFYKADSVPSEWKEGAVSAKITNIEFEE